MHRSVNDSGKREKIFWQVVSTRRQLQKNYNSSGYYTRYRSPNLWNLLFFQGCARAAVWELLERGRRNLISSRATGRTNNTADDTTIFYQIHRGKHIVTAWTPRGHSSLQYSVFDLGWIWKSCSFSRKWKRHLIISSRATNKPCAVLAECYWKQLGASQKLKNTFVFAWKNEHPASPTKHKQSFYSNLLE